MYNVKIMTRAEVDAIYNLPEHAYANAELFIFSNNDDNAYMGVIYKHGDMWVYGARYDSQVASLKEMLDQITSDDN